MRLHYRDPPLVWLFLPAYLAHLGEELFAGPGFAVWLARVVGQPLPMVAFLAINTIALAALIVGIRAAVRREEAGWVVVAVATIAVTNAVAHLIGSIITGTYSPGLVTGFVLYVPLGSIALLRAGYQAQSRNFQVGVIAGLLIHTLVFALAFASTRMSWEPKWQWGPRRASAGVDVSRQWVSAYSTTLMPTA
jgi:hypothetical protein